MAFRSNLDPDADCPKGWKPSPRPTIFDDQSSSDDCMVTPRSEASTISGGSSSKKRSRDNHLELDKVEESASPVLKPYNTMKRTPQPTLSQSKLTAMFQSQPPKKLSLPGDAPPAEAGTKGHAAEADTECMDVTPVPPGASTSVPPVACPAPAITIDVLMSALKENRDFIIKSVNANMNALSQRIDTNVSSIAANSAAIVVHDTRLENHRSDIDGLEERIRAIEKGKIAPPFRAHTRAVLSQDYLLARRSICLWPVAGIDEEELWGGV